MDQYSDTLIPRHENTRRARKAPSAAAVAADRARRNRKNKELSKERETFFRTSYNMEDED